MKPNADNRLLRLVWGERLYRPERLNLVDGGRIEVVSPGDPDDVTGSFTGAQIVLGGAVCRGDVLVGECGGDRNPRLRAVADRAVLQVVAAPSVPVCRAGGDPLPQAVMAVEESVLEVYGELLSRAGSCRCGEEIARMDGFKRLSLMTRLQVERLHRKSCELMEIHAGGGENWNETLYVMLFRAMGDNRNKEAFTRLARTVPYTAVSRERGSLFSVEALLLGGSGLLETRSEDDYILHLRKEFEYLRRKYGIVPMRPIAWKLGGIQPYNAPVLRIVQMAAFLTAKEFVFDNLLACRTPQDVQRLFSAEASGYWTTHFTPSRRSAFTPKRIGTEKANLLGINLVSVLQFAYANSRDDDRLREAAIALLEQTPCERNQIVAGWQACGVEIGNAFDSQAMLELTRLYCEQKRCAECGLGKYLIKRRFA